MKKEEIVKQGISLYGSARNRKEHKKLAENIEMLNTNNKFNRMDLANLRIFINKCLTDIQGLKYNVRKHFEVIFKNLKLIEHRLDFQQKMIDKQEKEIQELKIKISELQSKM